MKLLKEKRLEKKYSYNRMAIKLHISKSYYYQIENDKRRLTYDMAIKIANIFKMTPDELFYDDIKEIYDKK